MGEAKPKELPRLVPARLFARDGWVQRSANDDAIGPGSRTAGGQALASNRWGWALLWRRWWG